MSTGHRSGKSIAGPTLVLGAVAAVLSLLTANPGLTALAVAVLVFVALLTWRAGAPPILPFLCVIQWLQASAKVFHADVQGVELHDLPAAHHLEIGTAATIEEAALLSLAWVATLAVGIRVSRAGTRIVDEREAPAALHLPRLLSLYGGATLAVLALTPFASGGLRQVIVAAADLRWAVVFAVFWTVLRSARSRVWLFAIFAAEVAAGFLSYFASFRVPVYLLAIAVAAGPMAFRARRIVGFAGVAAIALYLGVVWSAVKVDYRQALNQGTGAQIVAIDRVQQASELARLLGSVDRDMLSTGLENLVDRIGYIDYFAYCLEHVPALQPHEDGLLWRQALGHVLQPRLLFPDKPALESDTLIAERYTGLDLMSWTETTSVALGLAAEAYVDFGVPWMFLAALWVGLLYGLAYRVIADRGGFPVLRQAVAVAMLLPLATLEPSTTKFLGGYLTRLLFAFLVVTFVLPYLGRWVSQAPARRITPRVRAVPVPNVDSRLSGEEHVPTR